MTLCVIKCFPGCLRVCQTAEQGDQATLYIGLRRHGQWDALTGALLSVH